MRVFLKPDTECGQCGKMPRSLPLISTIPEDIYKKSKWLKVTFTDGKEPDTLASSETKVGPAHIPELSIFLFFHKEQKMLFQSLVTTSARSEVAVISDTVNTPPQHSPSTGSQSLKTITLLGKRDPGYLSLYFWDFSNRLICCRLMTHRMVMKPDLVFTRGWTRPLIQIMPLFQKVLRGWKQMSSTFEDCWSPELWVVLSSRHSNSLSQIELSPGTEHSKNVCPPCNDMRTRRFLWIFQNKIKTPSTKSRTQTTGVDWKAVSWKALAIQVWLKGKTWEMWPTK